MPLPLHCGLPRSPTGASTNRPTKHSHCFGERDTPHQHVAKRTLASVARGTSRSKPSTPLLSVPVDPLNWQGELTQEPSCIRAGPSGVHKTTTADGSWRSGSVPSPMGCRARSKPIAVVAAARRQRAVYIALSASGGRIIIYLLTAEMPVQ